MKDWDQVMGIGSQPYLAESTLDQVQYVIRQAYGCEMADIPEFGPSSKK